ncbi:ShlB/FhaC/HecB family hemolysin secretion/activation protein [Pseudorhodoferax soli]|uniref:ShlB/FhaC/HecB family hemolysin secretion/activation protein n=1 Tax=Pseudorhodoferax soli TaxID=545864 RepID=UPI000DF38C55|nr:ShlB/FhaC/HecB family hemolysin secretion/activation protein [Pseudorhodoferax soli]
MWLALAGPVAAQAPAPVLRGVLLQGDTVLPGSRVQAAVAALVGQPADDALLAQLRRTVAGVYDAAGLGLVAVDAPRLFQGVALLRVQPLVLGRVVVQPDAGAAAQAEVLAALPALQGGRSPDLHALDRQLRLANLQPHRRWTIDFRTPEATAVAPAAPPAAPPATGFSSLPGQSIASSQDAPAVATPPIRPVGPAADNSVDAHVLLDGGGPFYGRLLLDNDGQDATGRERARLQVGHGDALGPGRALDLTLLTSLAHPARQRQVALRYQHPLPAQATLLTVEASRATSRPGLVQDFFDVSGDSRSLNLSARHLLARRGALEPYVEAGVERSVYDDVVGFSGVNLGSKVGVLPLALTLGATWQGAGTSAFGQARLRHNTGWGGYAGSSDYGSARAGATPRWTTLDLAGEARWQVAAHGEFSARAQAQWSPHALISAQQFRMGGASMLRGLREGELGGDQGTAVALEFWWALPAAHRVGVLLDGASVWRHQAGTGDLGRASAASTGLAWQWRPLPGLRLQATIARLLAVNHLPQREAGDTRAHLLLDWSF